MFGEREEGSRTLQWHPKGFPVLVAASLCQQSHPRREQLPQHQPGSHPDPPQSYPPQAHEPASSHAPNPSSPPSSFLLPIWMLSIHSELLPISLPRRGSSPISLHSIQNIYYYNSFFLLFLSPSAPQAPSKGFQRFSCALVTAQSHIPWDKGEMEWMHHSFSRGSAVGKERRGLWVPGAEDTPAELWEVFERRGLSTR